MSDSLPTTDPVISWRKLLHHVQEYRKLLSLSDDWSYGREDEINKHAKALRAYPNNPAHLKVMTAQTRCSSPM